MADHGAEGLPTPTIVVLSVLGGVAICLVAACIVRRCRREPPRTLSPAPPVPSAARRCKCAPRSCRVTQSLSACRENDERAADAAAFSQAARASPC
jgi:hypothetical protein